MIAEIEIPIELRDERKVHEVCAGALGRYFDCDEANMNCLPIWTYAPKDTIKLFVTRDGQFDPALTEQFVSCLVEEIVNELHRLELDAVVLSDVPKIGLHTVIRSIPKLTSEDRERLERGLGQPGRVFRGIAGEGKLGDGFSNDSERSYTDWQTFREKDAESLAPIFANNLSVFCEARRTFQTCCDSCRVLTESKSMVR